MISDYSRVLISALSLLYLKEWWTKKNEHGKPFVTAISPLSDPEHRQLSLYAKEKHDHFHVYDADKYSHTITSVNI